MHQPVLDWYEESRVVTCPRQIHCAVRWVQTLVPSSAVPTYTIIQSIHRITSSSRRYGPSVRLLKLRLERTVLLDLLYLLLGLGLISYLLRLGFGFCEPAPSLLSRFDHFGFGHLAWVDLGLESALFGESFISLSDKLDGFLSLGLSYLLSDLAGDSWLEELSIITHGNGRLSWLRRLILGRNGRSNGLILIIFRSEVFVVLVRSWCLLVVKQRRVRKFLH